MTTDQQARELRQSLLMTLRGALADATFTARRYGKTVTYDRVAEVATLADRIRDIETMVVLWSDEEDGR